MKKSKTNFNWKHLYSDLVKILLVMKLTFLLILISAISVLAGKTYSQTKKLNMNIENATVKEVLSTIESQSEFYFMYSEKIIDVNRRVSMNMDGQYIETVLNKLFEGTDVNYTVKDRIIVLTTPEVFNSEELTGQQQKPITGKVTDSSNQPLPGVTVVVKGTNNGTVTNATGNYTVTNIPEGAVLLISFVGMKTQEIAVGTQTTINVVLVEETVGIDEVVAVGYGTQKKVNLTGSVSSLSSKELNSSSTSNISTQLAGKLPGLRVIQRSGEPGSYSTLFDIRGFGTPLIIIDGILGSVSDFVRIDPIDIDQVSILKDASAAVYGVKAANGVVIVTTKKGEIGKPKISYTGSYTLSKYINLPVPGDAYDFARITTEMEINSGTAPNATTYKPEDLQKYKDGTYPSTDWMDLLNNNAKSQKHNISISGGSERIRYLTSFGTIYEMGIWESRDLNYKRYNLRSVVTGKITDNLEAELNINAMQDNSNRLSNPTESILWGLWTQPPIGTFYANNNPEYLNDVWAGNPLGSTNASYGGYSKRIIKAFQGNFTLNYNVPFIKGLNAKFIYGYYNNDTYDKTWFKKYFLYKYDPLTQSYLNNSTINSPSTLSANYSPYRRSTVMGQVVYDRVFLEKHTIKATLVFEERHEINDNLQASKQFDIDIDQFYAGLKNPTVTSDNINENDNQSVISRINYNYLSKYLFEFGFNYNGSSKFPKGKRWGFFPYTSIGWRISEEEFFHSKLPFITNLKFRGSWGIMGDDAASTFQFLTGYTYPVGNYVFNDLAVSGLGFKGIPNPNITWYTINSKNIGFDASIKKGLINLSFDIFQRDRSG
jgi:TonB-linked SusC/RagA family outer membrane protein